MRDGEILDLAARLKAVGDAPKRDEMFESNETQVDLLQIGILNAEAVRLADQVRHRKARDAEAWGAWRRQRRAACAPTPPGDFF